VNLLSAAANLLSAAANLLKKTNTTSCSQKNLILKRCRQ
jgi:hypothetical protein